MTPFGKWFAAVVVIVIALFAVGLALPSPENNGAAATSDRSFTGNRRVAPASQGAPSQAGDLPPGSADSISRALVTRSGLVLPVAGIRPEQLADTFGDPRGVEGERGHGALDIMAPQGTPVLAAADGRVEKLLESVLGGHTIYVRSPNRRNVYYYAHLDTYAPGVREGVAVRAGQRIGAVGASGDADPGGPHLHFEITRVDPGGSPHEGRPINPYPLLAGGPAGG